MLNSDYHISPRPGMAQVYLRILMLLTGSMLFSCSHEAVKDSAPAADSVDIDSIPDAIPRPEPRSKYGNPESYEVFGKRYHVMKDPGGFTQRGIASWYGNKFHGRRTSNGETYDMYAMTAAHKSLPLPSYIEVTNLKNKKHVIVRVNDRGPFHENRILDLSYTAARKLGIVATGTGLVQIRVIEPGSRAKKDRAVKYGAPVRSAQAKAGDEGFYIQVGAFADADNARRLQDKVSSLGDKLVVVNETVVNGNPVYRVQIGPIYSVDRADDIVAKLGNYGITEHHIVVRPY